MISKESLNNIKNLFIGSSINLIQQFEIIEKDLERLEKLEKENQELKEQINRFQKVIEDIKNLPSYIGIGFKNMFDNCKLTSLPESPELKNELEKLRSYKNDSCR